MEAGSGISLSDVQLALGLLVILTPTIIGLVFTTAWGQRHKAALEQTQGVLSATQGALSTVIDAVGQAHSNGDGTTASVLERMTAAETRVPPPIVSTWKSAVQRWRDRSAAVRAPGARP